MAGRRERRKQETAERIAAVAAGLFASRGFEQVAVTDVAEAADVAPQTVYNHFPAKEDLVFDRDAALDEALRRAVADREAGTPAADAVGRVVDGLLAATGRADPASTAGGMPRLAAQSEPLRRAMIERTRRHADTLAGALAGGGRPGAAEQAAGWALAGLLQLALEDLGRAQAAGDEPGRAATRLRAANRRRVAALRAVDVSHGSAPSA